MNFKSLIKKIALTTASIFTLNSCNTTNLTQINKKEIIENNYNVNKYSPKINENTLKFSFISKATPYEHFKILSSSSSEMKWRIPLINESYSSGNGIGSDFTGTINATGDNFTSSKPNGGRYTIVNPKLGTFDIGFSHTQTHPYVFNFSGTFNPDDVTKTGGANFTMEALSLNTSNCSSARVVRNSSYQYRYSTPQVTGTVTEEDAGNGQRKLVFSFNYFETSPATNYNCTANHSIRVYFTSLVIKTSPFTPYSCGNTSDATNIYNTISGANSVFSSIPGTASYQTQAWFLPFIYSASASAFLYAEAATFVTLGALYQDLTPSEKEEMDQIVEKVAEISVALYLSKGKKGSISEVELLKELRVLTQNISNSSNKVKSFLNAVPSIQAISLLALSYANKKLEDNNCTNSYEANQINDEAEQIKNNTESSIEIGGNNKNRKFDNRSIQDIKNEWLEKKDSNPNYSGKYTSNSNNIPISYSEKDFRNMALDPSKGKILPNSIEELRTIEAAKKQGLLGENIQISRPDNNGEAVDFIVKNDDIVTRYDIKVLDESLIETDKIANKIIENIEENKVDKIIIDPRAIEVRGLPDNPPNDFTGSTVQEYRDYIINKFIDKVNESVPDASERIILADSENHSKIEVNTSENNTIEF